MEVAEDRSTIEGASQARLERGGLNPANQPAQASQPSVKGSRRLGRPSGAPRLADQEMLHPVQGIQLGLEDPVRREALELGGDVFVLIRQDALEALQDRKGHGWVGRHQRLELLRLPETFRKLLTALVIHSDERFKARRRSRPAHERAVQPARRRMDPTHRMPQSPVSHSGFFGTHRFHDLPPLARRLLHNRLQRGEQLLLRGRQFGGGQLEALCGQLIGEQHLGAAFGDIPAAAVPVEPLHLQQRQCLVIRQSAGNRHRDGRHGPLNLNGLLLRLLDPPELLGGT